MKWKDEIVEEARAAKEATPHSSIMTSNACSMI